MTRLLLLDACVVIDFAECGVELLTLASRHLGTVHVAAPVLAEVRSVALGSAPIQAIEPTVAELEEAALGGGGVSFADRVTLILAERRGVVVVTPARAAAEDGLDRSDPNSLRTSLRTITAPDCRRRRPGRPRRPGAASRTRAAQ